MCSSGSDRGAFAEEPQHIAGAFERVGDQAAGDGRPYRMQLIFEGGRHAEVSASAANGPEQIGLLVLAGPQHLAFGGDELDGPRLSRARPYLPISQPSPPPRVSPAIPVVETTPPVTARPCSCVSRLSSRPGDAALRAHRSALGIDVNALHRRQVDHHPAIDGRASRHVVAAAANRDLEAELARELDGIDDVGHAAASGDQCRALVHQSVVDLSRFLVAGVRRLQELSPEGVRQAQPQRWQRIGLRS